MDNLRFIRHAMEQATPVTAVSGWGMAAVGGVAALMAPVAHLLPTRTHWVLAWVATAVLAMVIVVGASVRKARRNGITLLSGAGRKFLLGFAPAMAVGGLLTLAFWLRGDVQVLPAVWMLLYGTAVTSAGAYSVRAVPVMGLCFLGCGALALALPAFAGDALMGIAFGGLHLGFGFWVAERHGG
jgi:hypothetical protein